MNAIRLTTGLTSLTLMAVLGSPGHAQNVPAPGTSVTYTCNGGVTLNVFYPSRDVARVNFGGAIYTLPRRTYGQMPPGGTVQYADQVTSWNIGGGGGFLNQNGQTVLSGCFAGGDGSSTIIPVNPGGGTSTIIPGPGFGPVIPAPPTVNTVNYTCDGGRRVAVAYLGANAAQLFWQGGTDTLYQTASGSGVRYTNGFYTWVTKGNQGFLQQQGLNQPYIIVANNCVAFSQ